MFQRSFHQPSSQSFFLFGARGTGKSSWLASQFDHDGCWLIDLLDPEQEDRFRQRPKLLETEYLAKNPKPKWIVIDEVQRAPRLLDLVHRMIEKYKVRFAMSGSSARKLRRGASNLLAGRAFVHYLFPMTFTELGDAFELTATLAWGSLPRIYALSDVEKAKYLRAYALVYLNEEIRAEQVVRKLEPFREFLRIAAQHNGKVLNYSAIADDVGVDIKTIKSYFEILADTWMGFQVSAYHTSVRKAQRRHPKFFWFDLGVKRALEETLEMHPRPGTSYFGDCFEHLVVNEIFRVNQYLERDYRLAYFQTQNSDAEIDLILSKGRVGPILIEIKSTERVDEREVASLARLAAGFKPSAVYYLSRDLIAKKMRGVDCLFWQDGVRRIMGI